MKNLSSIIQEKLRLGKDTKIHDYTKIYGKGEEQPLRMCSLPKCKDVLASHEILQIWSYFHDFGINMNTDVYFMKGAGTFEHQTDLTNNFKNNIRNCPDENITPISDFEPHIQIKKYVMSEYINDIKKDTCVVQVTNWKEEPMLTYWYIKL